MKRLLVIVLALVLLLGAAGCSGTDRSSANEGENAGNGGEAQTPARTSTLHLSVSTGPVGGSMYVISSSWADQVNKSDANIQITNQVGGGSAICVRVLGNGEADFAMVGNDIAYYASRGEEVFADAPLPQLRSVGALYAEGFHVIVRQNSGIESMEDLLDRKTTSIGPPGSGTLLNSERVLAAYGYEKSDVGARELDFTESAEAIRDGHVDAACYMTGVPYGPVTDISITQPINVFGLRADVIDDLLAQYPFFVKTTYPANTYDGTDAFDTIAVRMLLVTTEDMDEDAVYEVTKLLVENLDAVADSHSCGTTISRETLLDGLSVPLHPGAERYYQEIGLL